MPPPLLPLLLLVCVEAAPRCVALAPLVRLPLLLAVLAIIL
jgi:hypothetical protein